MYFQDNSRDFLVLSYLNHLKYAFQSFSMKNELIIFKYRKLFSVRISYAIFKYLISRI